MVIKYARTVLKKNGIYTVFKKKEKREEKMEDLNKSWKKFHCNKESCIKMGTKKFRIKFSIII